MSEQPLDIATIELIKSRVATAIRAHWGQGVYVSRVEQNTMDFGHQLGVMFESYIAEWPNKHTIYTPATWQDGARRALYSRLIRAKWFPQWLLDKARVKWPVKQKAWDARLYFPDVPVTPSLDNRIAIFERGRRE